MGLTNILVMQISLSIHWNALLQTKDEYLLLDPAGPRPHFNLKSHRLLDCQPLHFTLFSLHLLASLLELGHQPCLQPFEP